MSKAPQFGTRAAPVRPSPGQAAPDGHIVHTLSRLDLIRGILATQISEYKAAPAAQKDSCFIRIRTIQDQILHFHHRHPSAAARASSLAWVDSWKPD